MLNQTLFLLAAGGNPVDHVTDKPIYGMWEISNVTVMLVLSAIVTALLVIPAAKKITTGKTESIDDYRAQGVLANLVEAVCKYLRDDVFRAMLGDDTDKYMPMLWTFFWFILINNLLGLVPILDITAMFGLNPYHGNPVGIGGTATQSIWVTGTLAVIAFLWYNGIGLSKDPVGYFKHLTGGAPAMMWPIMVPVEIIGTFVKPFALALRLFANMTGGHIVVATLLGFVTQLCMWKAGIGHGMALIPLFGTIAIYMLELLVAFIQAFIFSYLTGLFLSQLVHHDDHEHEHDHEAHGDEEGEAAVAH
jgi:F-type H+-transporting ATPase subunit a